jgi:hypothetical protein
MTRQTRIAVTRQDILHVCADAIRTWFYTGEIDAADLRAKVDAILAQFIAEELGRGDAS